MQNAAISIICLTVRFFIIPHPYRGIPALNYLFFIITYIERKIYLKSKKSAVLTWIFSEYVLKCRIKESIAPQERRKKMDIVKQLSEEFGLRADYAKNIVELIDDGNTIPFIARYRKEMHGSCNDQVLRDFSERLAYLRNLGKRKEELKTELNAKIYSCHVGN